VLRNTLGPQARFDCALFKVVGLAESIVEERVAPTLADLKDIELGYSAKMGEVEVRIISHLKPTATKRETDSGCARGQHLWTDDDRLEEVVVKLLAAVRKTVAVAESCTAA